MAEDVARLLSAARSKGKLTTAERKRAQALMISVAVSLGYIAQGMPYTMRFLLIFCQITVSLQLLADFLGEYEQLSSLQSNMLNPLHSYVAEP